MKIAESTYIDDISVFSGIRFTCKFHYSVYVLIYLLLRVTLNGFYFKPLPNENHLGNRYRWESYYGMYT